MANQKIEFDYNEHKLRALKKVFKGDDKILSLLNKALDMLYDKNVSPKEKQYVEFAIQADDKKEAVNANSFSIIHLHDNDADVFFTARNCNTLYDLIKLFNEEEIDFMAASNYSVDSIMLSFEGYSIISEEVFNALSSALTENDIITQEAHLEFDVNTLEFRNKEHPDMFGFDLNDLNNVYETIHDETISDCENEAQFDECIKSYYDGCDEDFSIGM